MNKIISVFHKIKNNQKNYDLLINIITTFAIKGSSLIIGLFSMPLYIQYFNNQIALGMWFTLLSMLSWIFMFDLGLGNGLRNMLVQPIVTKNHQRVRELVSSAYILMGIVVVIIGLLGLIIIPKIDWNSVLRISTNYISEVFLIKGIFILYFGILFHFWLKLLNSIFYALQRPFMNNLMILIGSLIQVIYIAMPHEGDLNSKFISLSIVYIFSICFPLFGTSVVVFMTSLRKSVPTFKYFRMSIARSVFRLGGAFFIVQISYMILTSTNEIIITRLFGNEYVVTYQIYNRIFSSISSLFSLALVPLWSGITKAIAERDFLWIKKINRVLYLISFLATCCLLLIVPFLQWIIDIWLKDSSVQVNYSYAIVFALVGSIFLFNVVLTTVANGVGYLKTQLIFYSIGALLKVPLIILLQGIYNDWIVVVISNILILIPFCIVQLMWLNKYVNNLLTNR